jgi:serine protease AprX
MSDRLLVTIQTPEAREAVRTTGVRVLAEYPNAVLVDATSDQADALRATGLETLPIERPPVRTASAEYEFEDARTAETDAPVAVDDKRTAYYLLQLPGPLTDEWLQRITAAGGKVKSTLPGHRVVVGMLPQDAEAVRSEEFVDVATYRPAMKVSPHLRRDVKGVRLDTGTLREVGQLGMTGGPEQVQISVFEGESTEEVGAIVEGAGGDVLSQDARTIIASVPPEALHRLAELQEVEAILPYEFPMLSNDRAAVVMGVPADRDFGGVTLTGAGQMVGVVDSGLDTGDPASVHPDLLGRVTIVPTPVLQARWRDNTRPADPNPADPHGHGTHVAGSIAGNSAAAEAAGSLVRPSGIAPAASLHFTAVGHHVNWLPGAPAYLRPWGLHGLPQPNPAPLLEVAYAAGARIHTISFGVSNTPGNANVEGTYDPQARSFDNYMVTHRDALVVCTAGNNGRDIDHDLAIDADSIGSPGTAKNVLTVGGCQNDRPAGSTPTPGQDVAWDSSESFAAFADAGHMSGDPDEMALFSSRGPTDDNRIKPEVVAPATNVLSTLTQRYDGSLLDNGPGAEPLWGLMDPSDPLAKWYCWGGGTSMACPLVAGAAALVREYLVVHRGHEQDGVAPSGALLKAYLVNGAVPMNGAGIPPAPNNVNGFGRVNVSVSLEPGQLGRTAFSDDPSLAVASLQVRIFTVQVVDPGDPLVVTLCWTDPPGEGLQNKLYLRVQPPGGVAPVDGDVTPYNRPTNPTQRVVIAPPIAGIYEIQVHGIDVAGVQDFAVVSSNATTLTMVQ